MDALMFPLSEYVLKLIPSLVIFCSKEGQTLAWFTKAPLGKADLNLHVSSIFSKITPEKFLKNKYFVDECLLGLPMQQKLLTTRFMLPVPQGF